MLNEHDDSIEKKNPNIQQIIFRAGRENLTSNERGLTQSLL